MTSVLIERSKNGVLVSCRAEGHSGYAVRGSDIVCSAVTVLIRTTLQVLSGLPGVELETDTSQRGYVSFKVLQSFSSECEEKLKYAGDFLVTGLASVQEEFPENLELVINSL
ncbi:MAG: ribosomal-processing cysteine protease Prp [Treponema sp.]|nr:ribosomal-processing cysteine protease Prp [Treponema sp.]